MLPKLLIFAAGLVLGAITGATLWITCFAWREDVFRAKRARERKAVKRVEDAFPLPPGHQPKFSDIRFVPEPFIERPWNRVDKFQ